MSYKPSQFERQSLRDLLKRGTNDIHSIADGLFQDHVVKKRMSQKTYKLFLSQLYYLYEAMENGLERHKDHPIVGPVQFGQELFRMPNLKLDLEFFYGEDWENCISCMASTQAYVDRLNELSEHNPQVLISHAYVRYQGDVSGGQILKKIIRRTYGFSERTGEGVRFYEFENLDSITSFKDFYSARMNALELTAEQKEEMVTEAVDAFQHNINIFSEIVAIAEKDPEGYMKDKKPFEAKACPILHNDKQPSENNQTDTSATDDKCPVTHTQNGAIPEGATCPAAHAQNGITSNGQCPVSGAANKTDRAVSRWTSVGAVTLVAVCAALIVLLPKLSERFT